MANEPTVEQLQVEIAMLQRNIDELRSELHVLPTEEERLKALGEAFQEGAEEQLKSLGNYQFHPQSTGLWNPYEVQLRDLQEAKLMAAEGWKPYGTIPRSESMYFLDELEVDSLANPRWERRRSS